MKLNIGDDHAVSAIEALQRNGQAPTYAWLKHEFGRSQISEQVYRSLDYGRAILSSVDQLDQYLYSYSPMVASQWVFAIEHMSYRPNELQSHVIDYGCGQGLAGLLLCDHFGLEFLEGVRTITAVEPSAVALRRATAIYQALAPGALIRSVNKGFGALVGGDLAADSEPTIHIFSNVLDIDGYDHVALLRKGLTRGHHTIIAVGHDRTKHGYSQGLQRIKAAVDTGSIRSGIKVHMSGLEQFTCGNRGEPAVLWLCKLEVSDE